MSFTLSKKDFSPFFGSGTKCSSERIDSKKCFKNKEVANKAKNEWAIDYRHNEYFGDLKSKLDKKYASKLLFSKVLITFSSFFDDSVPAKFLG